MAAIHAKTRTQQLARKAHIAHLAERGWTLADIAAELGVSVPCVQYHLRSIEQMWLDQIFCDMTLIKARKAAELAAVKKAAWESFDASRQAAGGDEDSSDVDADEEVEAVLDILGIKDPRKEVDDLVGYDTEEPDPDPYPALNYPEVIEATATSSSPVVEIPDEDEEDVELGVIDRKYPTPTRDDLDEPGIQISDTARLIMTSGSSTNAARAGLSSNEFSKGNVPFTEETFRQFQEDGERRLQALRDRKGRGRVGLTAKKGLRPRGRPVAGGDPAYLRVVLEALKSEKDMLGLDAPKRFLGLRISPEDVKNMSDDDIDKMIAKLGGPELLQALEAARHEGGSSSNITITLEEEASVE